MRKKIEDPKVYFEDLGGLHDARIEYVRWVPKSRSLEIGIDDINSNSADLPGYLGFQPQTILLDEVAEIEVGVSPCGNILTIFDFIMTRERNTYFIEIKCRPGGSIKLTCSSISLMNPEDKSVADDS